MTLVAKGTPTLLCDACGWNRSFMRGYITAQSRRRLWYAPWKWREARPAAVRLECERCHKVHDMRPGTFAYPLHDLPSDG